MVDIFIVDDSETIRERLIDLVQEIPDVSTGGQAADADDALLQIRAVKPDVVITDIHMPGDSFKLVEQIKRSPVHPIVIMLTNYPYKHYREKFMDLGVDYFFDKTTEFEQAIQAIQTIAEQTGRKSGR